MVKKWIEEFKDRFYFYLELHLVDRALTKRQKEIEVEFSRILDEEE
jgi:hypothetical protein